MEWPLCVGSFPVEHPGDANINTKGSFLFFRTCSHRLPVSKASKVLASGLQTGVRTPRRILDGLNVLRARHAKRPSVISWRYLDYNKLSFTKSPFLNYSFKYSVLSAEVASKIEMVIFRKMLLHHPFSCASRTQIRNQIKKKLVNNKNNSFRNTTELQIFTLRIF